MTAPFFAADGLGVSFDRPVLENVCFGLERGTLTGLLGANGVGKTTLLRAVCGLLPHRGRCMLEGELLEGLSARELARRVSYIPQRGSGAVSLPALDMVLMGFHARMEPLEYPGRTRRTAARAALEAVGAGGLAGRSFRTLSEGQKQLVLLARTLVEDTRLLVLDEPDSALDFRNRHRIMRTLRGLVKSGDRAGLLCLHDPALALEYCESLLLLRGADSALVLRPGRDPAGTVEERLREVYGPLTLREVPDRQGARHLVLLPEGEGNG